MWFNSYCHSVELWKLFHLKIIQLLDYILSRFPLPALYYWGHLNETISWFFFTANSPPEAIILNSWYHTHLQSNQTRPWIHWGEINKRNGGTGKAERAMERGMSGENYRHWGVLLFSPLSCWFNFIWVWITELLLFWHSYGCG